MYAILAMLRVPAKNGITGAWAALAVALTCWGTACSSNPSPLESSAPGKSSNAEVEPARAKEQVAVSNTSSKKARLPEKKSSSGDSEHVNLDEIFPPGRGRALVLNNCTTCHTFVPIVLLQLTKEAWERNSNIHRDRVPSLSDADFRVLYDYLEASFNPDRPVPKLPQALLDTWTSY